MRLILAVLMLCMTSGLMAQPQTPSLQEQSICAKQAKIAFEEWNASRNKVPDLKPFNGDYQSHYNSKLNKCLILIEGIDEMNGQILTSATLMDAFERRVFAHYLWETKEGKKYWEVPPTACELIPTSQEKTDCSSKEEFDAFVAKYMEQ
jgi:hypothetical protein